MKPYLRILTALLFITAVLTSCESNDSAPEMGYLHADGRNIVDGSGERFIIRAMGIGSWMVMEPYMFKMNQEANEGQHKMLSEIGDVIGEENMPAFRSAWLKNFFTEADVAAAKKAGFNTLRPALHYNLFTLPIEEEPVRGADTWLEPGFVMLDSLIEWSARHELYVILDLHAAPGGQGYNGNINDYDPSKPSLWEDEENQRKTVALWEKFAERYVDNPWVGGYDLINETNWTFENKENINGCDDEENKPLFELYRKLIPAIRKHDSNHIIFIEGNCWANNHNGLWPLDDPANNLSLSFHKYWNPNTYDQIERFVELSKKYDVPLWMSESGENSNDWFTEAVCLLEGHNIGWSWWTWKKLDSESGSYSIKIPEGYEKLQSYWEGEGEKPSKDEALSTMMALTDNLLLENCARNDAAIDALMVYKTLENPMDTSAYQNILAERLEAAKEKTEQSTAN